MTSRELQLADTGTNLEVLPPVLLNTYKHHAAALRRRLDQIGTTGVSALLEAVRAIDVLGTRLMDLYTGTLMPRDLSRWVIDELQTAAVLDMNAYRHWVITQEEDYRILTHPHDGSRWVLRCGNDPLRYVHVHPARWSPASMRVKATVLKTAFIVLAHTRVHGGDPLDRTLINAVRAEHLGLPPLGQDLDGELGLGAVLGILRN